MRRRLLPILTLLAAAAVVVPSAVQCRRGEPGDAPPQRDSMALAERPGQSTLPTVVVPLAGRKGEIRSSGLDERSARSLTNGHGNVPESHVLTVVLPDGRGVTLEVRRSSISSKRAFDVRPEGEVASVYADRPIEPGGFQAVLADLHRTVRAMGCEPTETMEQMWTWGDVPGTGERPGITPHSVLNAGRLHLGGVSDVQVRFIPAERGWRYTMIFHATAPAAPPKAAPQLSP